MEILRATEPVGYEEAVSFMERRVADIHEKRSGEAIWLVEHPPLYTAGTSAQAADLIDQRFPVFKTGRGGQYTYHGPGQRVAYVMLDLRKRQQSPDIKEYIWSLEEWVIRALARFDIQGARREGRVGIWVDTPAGEAKVAAIGVRVRHWVTYHGVAVNVDPDLSHFAGIVPCGLREFGVTSLVKLLGRSVSLREFDEALLAEWPAAWDPSPDASG